MLLLDGNRFELDALKDLEGFEVFLERIKNEEQKQDMENSTRTGLS